MWVFIQKLNFVLLYLFVCLGVYLSRYSDLLQVNSFTPGATGEILIFKVMKVNQLVDITRSKRAEEFLFSCSLICFQ